MSGQRGSTVRRFADTDDLWPVAEAYAARHDLKGGASEVVRMALRDFLQGKIARPSPGKPDAVVESSA